MKWRAAAALSKAMDWLNAIGMQLAKHVPRQGTFVWWSLSLHDIVVAMLARAVASDDEEVGG